MKRITINRLHKILTAEIAKGRGKIPVTIHKDTFTHPLESDGCTVLDVVDCDVEYINIMDDDGSHAVNKDGSERIRLNFILLGVPKEDVEKTLKRQMDFV